MKKFWIVAIPCFLADTTCFSQNLQYDSLVQIANRYFDSSDFNNALTAYTTAFKVFDGKGYPEDKYKVAKCWAITGGKDSAFAILNRLTDRNLIEFLKLINEKEFKVLHPDQRWNLLLKKLNPNDEVYHDSLAQVLSKIFDDDQKYRLLLDSIDKKYSYESSERKRFWQIITTQDSINLEQVLGILNYYGWLSANEVGKTGNSAIWLVIQHADLGIQEKYFPIMQQAVTAGKASKQHLAYLQDRILVRQGKKQLYGTQYITDGITNVTRLDVVEDPENLNKRRESVGLPPVQQDK